jgi:hypothetical protein
MRGRWFASTTSRRLPEEDFTAENAENAERKTEVKGQGEKAENAERQRSKDREKTRREPS